MLSDIGIYDGIDELAGIDLSDGVGEPTEAGAYDVLGVFMGAGETAVGGLEVGASGEFGGVNEAAGVQLEVAEGLGASDKFVDTE